MIQNISNTQNPREGATKTVVVGTNLLEEVTTLVLLQSTFLNNIIKELTGLDILHHNIDVTRGLYDFILANDMRMHKQPQNLNLPPHCTEE